jgi:Domain of unknown function (DUF3883)
MSIQVIEWALVVRYGKSAHRATYGRLAGGTYTKDYIQLHRNPKFLADLVSAFPALKVNDGVAAITFKWPLESAKGKLILKSADRPHLAWDTNSAPKPWKMHEHPSHLSVETIRGNPSLKDKIAADLEYDNLLTSAFGQPFLIAVKMRNEIDTLHLRVLIENPSDAFAWADLKDAPIQIRELAAATSERSALAWKFFPDGDDPQIQFDPGSKISPWSDGSPNSVKAPSTEDGAIAGAPDDWDQETPTIAGTAQSPSVVATPALVLPIDIDFSAVLVAPPKPKSKVGVIKSGQGPKKVDHKQKAESNDAIGKLGEQFGIAYERWRLRDHPVLLKQLRHVSLKDDTLGYDIESFETDGTLRFVEVKATSGPMETRFFLSAAELASAVSKGEQYVLLRVAHLPDDPKCCEIRFPFEGKLELNPATYSVSFATVLSTESEA